MRVEASSRCAGQSVRILGDEQLAQPAARDLRLCLEGGKQVHRRLGPLMFCRRSMWTRRRNRPRTAEQTLPKQTIGY